MLMTLNWQFFNIFFRNSSANITYFNVTISNICRTFNISNFFDLHLEFSTFKIIYRSTCLHYHLACMWSMWRSYELNVSFLKLWHCTNRHWWLSWHRPNIIQANNTAKIFTARYLVSKIINRYTMYRVYFNFACVLTSYLSRLYTVCNKTSTIS